MSLNISQQMFWHCHHCNRIWPDGPYDLLSSYLICLAVGSSTWHSWKNVVFHRIMQMAVIWLMCPWQGASDRSDSMSFSWCRTFRLCSAMRIHLYSHFDVRQYYSNHAKSGSHGTCRATSCLSTIYHLLFIIHVHDLWHCNILVHFSMKSLAYM